jgi:hypothetical protein
MCPDPALLVAYLDRTLFSRDVIAVEQHVSGCEPCTALLADMRRHREAAQSAARWKYLAVPLAAIVVIGLGVWAFRPGSKDTTPPEPALTRSEPVPPAPIAAPPVVAIAKPTPPPKSAPTPKPTPPRKSAAPPKPAPSPVRTVTPRVQWRASDAIVARSTDGGVTWTTEYTADRPIRASAFVNADVGWVVGENGLILRRTKNGWFGASPPAEGHVTAVRATSPSKATVTLEDGRVFTTENGGVTWSSP